MEPESLTWALTKIDPARRLTTMDIDDGITLRAADDPTIKNELRRAWIADRLDERLGEFGQTHAVDVVCAT